MESSILFWNAAAIEANRVSHSARQREGRSTIDPAAGPVPYPW